MKALGPKKPSPDRRLYDIIKQQGPQFVEVVEVVRGEWRAENAVERRDRNLSPDEVKQGIGYHCAKSYCRSKPDARTATALRIRAIAQATIRAGDRLSLLDPSH